MNNPYLKITKPKDDLVKFDIGKFVVGAKEFISNLTFSQASVWNYEPKVKDMVCEEIAHCATEICAILEERRFSHRDDHYFRKEIAGELQYHVMRKAAEPQINYVASMIMKSGITEYEDMCEYLKEILS